MGVNDFLPRVLPSAGQSIDLRRFADGIVDTTKSSFHHRRKRKRRQLRIGVDVSCWIYKAAHGYGDMLADERHLSNYGRASLVAEQQQQQQQQQQNDNTMTNNNEQKQQQDNIYTNESIKEFVRACTSFVMRRLQTLRNEANADILVVLDGKTQPMKSTESARRSSARKEQERIRDEPVDIHATQAANDRRTKANRRAGAGRHYTTVLKKLLVALVETEQQQLQHHHHHQQHNQMAFLIAPYEADGQLAYLCERGLIDLVVTEDSDLIAHFAKSILYKSVDELGKGHARGILLQPSDLGATTKTLNLIDFSAAMIAVMFVAAGCDYCEKLTGIGIITACNVVREAFLKPHRSSPLKMVLDLLYQRANNRQMLTTNFKRTYESKFLAAVLAYRHPVVYDPVLRKTVEVRNPSQGGGDPELLSYPPYAKLCKSASRRQTAVGTLLNEDDAVAMAEGRHLLDRSDNDNNNDNNDNNETVTNAANGSTNSKSTQPQNNNMDAAATAKATAAAALMTPCHDIVNNVSTHNDKPSSQDSETPKNSDDDQDEEQFETQERITTKPTSLLQLNKANKSITTATTTTTERNSPISTSKTLLPRKRKHYMDSTTKKSNIVSHANNTNTPNKSPATKNNSIGSQHVDTTTTPTPTPTDFEDSSTSQSVGLKTQPSTGALTTVATMAQTTLLQNSNGTKAQENEQCQKSMPVTSTTSVHCKTTHVRRELFAKTKTTKITTTTTTSPITTTDNNNNNVLNNVDQQKQQQRHPTSPSLSGNSEDETIKSRSSTKHDTQPFQPNQPVIPVPARVLYAPSNNNNNKSKKKAGPSQSSSSLSATQSPNLLSSSTPDKE